MTTDTALFVDPPEAARRLAISARTLWSLTSPRGPIPAVRIGRLVRYRPDDLAAFAAAAPVYEARPEAAV